MTNNKQNIQKQPDAKTGYKLTKLGWIPEEWETHRIDEVLMRVRNKVDVVRDVSYQQIGIRSHAKGIFYKEFVSGEKLGNKSVFWLEEDCFIVNIVFAWEQAVSRTTKQEVGMIASHRFPMYKPKDNKSDIDYILYFFKTKKGKHLLGLASPGGAGRNKTLGQKEFSELKINLPPLPEQKAITTCLSTWGNAIELQDKKIKLLEKRKKGLMQQLLNEKFCNSVIRVKLKDISTITMGQSPSSSSYNANNKGFPLIQGNADIKNRKSIDRIYTTQITKKCYKGDVIMTVRAPVGKVGIASKDSVIGRGVCSMKPLNIQGKYFYYLMEYSENTWLKLEQGSTFTSVSSSDIFNFSLLIINSLEEQASIANILQTADKEIELEKAKLEKFVDEKKGLMQQLLTGNKRLRF